MKTQIVQQNSKYIFPTKIIEKAFGKRDIKFLWITQLDKTAY